MGKERGLLAGTSVYLGHMKAKEDKGCCISADGIKCPHRFLYGVQQPPLNVHYVVRLSS